MANYLCEMFGYVYYSDVLSYEDLLRRENYLLNDFKLVLLEHDAVHINNIPTGDSLLVQCSFSAYDDNLFERVCEGLHTVLCEYVYCKLLFVDKSLNFMHVCSLTHLGWLESTLHFPVVAESKLSKKLIVAKRGIERNSACKLYDSRIEVPSVVESDSEKIIESPRDDRPQENDEQKIAKE